MNYSLLFLCLLIVSAKNLRSRVYYEYSFETFRRFYSKEYSSVDEQIYRLNVFANNLDIIETHNKLTDTYKKGINQFADLTESEFMKSISCGCTRATAKRLVDMTDYKQINPPESIDWTEKGAVGPVKDQDACGSCWAFGTVGTLESVHFLKTQKMVVLSEQQLVDCSQEYNNTGCNGGEVIYAMNYVADHGICSLEDYPYTAKDEVCKSKKCKPVLKVTTRSDVTPSEDALQGHLALHPVSVDIDAQLLFLYSSGIIEGKCDKEVNHSVLAVGYGIDNGKKYWKLKNSWGGKWGEKGFMRMLRGVGGDKGQCSILVSAHVADVQPMN